MSGRFTIGLLIVFVLAVVIGLAAGKSQTVSVAAPAPTLTPTPISLPPANEIDIIHNPTGSPSAVYLSASSSSVAARGVS